MGYSGGAGINPGPCDEYTDAVRDLPKSEPKCEIRRCAVCGQQVSFNTSGQALIHTRSTTFGKAQEICPGYRPGARP